MWRRTLTAALSTTRHHPLNPNVTPAALLTLRCYAAKAPKSAKSATKSPVKKKPQPSKPSAGAVGGGGGGAAEESADMEEDRLRMWQLEDDEKNKTLDVGPNGEPLFTSTESISRLTRSDVCSYMRFQMEELNAVLPEGLPEGMVKEFNDSKRCALLVRRSFLDLRDNFRRIVDPPSWQSSSSKAPQVRKQIVLDGPRSCGKSIALAMLAHWARDEGWLVLYAPKGLEWTHGGFFYKNAQTGLWDTPLQAENILKDFLKFNEPRLQQLPCQVYDRIPLGQGAGLGFAKEEFLEVPEGSTLFDLAQTGIANTHAAVGVVVHLRKELTLVKDVPVLLAIDQYNSWYTFSQYHEVVTPRSTKPIHARDVATVNAFRPMRHNDMMVGAFSHSTAVGKLRKDLPGVPDGARVDFPRYSLDEAGVVSHYYLRQRLIRREVFTEEKWKKMYYLSNGNGAEMRSLAPLMW